MSTFTPPTLPEVSQLGDPTTDNRLGMRLMRFASPRMRGVMVAKMADATYRISRPVPGVTLSASLQLLEVWPALPAASTIDGTPYQVNNAIAMWYNPYSATPGTPSSEVQTPAVVLIYMGGHNYPVSAAEAAALTSAGLGAYVH
jgi:hypothetical protein